MDHVISIKGLAKTYATGVEALKPIDLDIRRGEIFALLGPNGAGKTTMISIVCGIVNASAGTVLVDGHDHKSATIASPAARSAWCRRNCTPTPSKASSPPSPSAAACSAARPMPAHIEKILKELSLWDKRKAKIMELSGGMKRRVMIAKALSHEPDILFLDEPTAGVDVELRRDMWNLVRELRESGVTIILTTHYIEEAEEMADRVGVISKGELILVDEKTALMKKLGRKELTLNLSEVMETLPPELAEWNLTLAGEGHELVYEFDANAEKTGVPSLLRRMSDLGIGFKDLNTKQSSLEDIFVSLVHRKDAA